MYKIRKVKFKDHPYLKNLELDFCGRDGKAVDTVIIAGENGTGKSTILDVLYKITTYKVDVPIDIVFEDDGEEFAFSYDIRKDVTGKETMHVNDGKRTYINGTNTMTSKYPFSGIFSEVAINFRADNISNVTSLELDSSGDSRRSTTKLATEIKQLLVDIQATDDSSVAQAVRVADNEEPIASLKYDERMPRFTKAFNHIFDRLTYSRVENDNKTKSILFQKNGTEIPIDSLSSGEKQIVYRGCFLLRDINATKGAFVFIDEPEISLHPTWQQKIMDYYKGIFTDENGVQTSQLFAATHSPFIVHNSNRHDDKVVILAYDDNGEIVAKDKPEYFACNGVEAVKDAFSIHDFDSVGSVVYLEGQTDEKYFNKAAEVYGYELPFTFKWVGHYDGAGNAKNTGKDALKNAANFLRSGKPSAKQVCLFDCDVKNKFEDIDNVLVCSLPCFDNKKEIKSGIENALILEDIDIEPYKNQKCEKDNYGIEKRIPNFQKTECCKYICDCDKEKLDRVFANLKTVIEELIKVFEGNDRSDFFDSENRNDQSSTIN